MVFLSDVDAGDAGDGDDECGVADDGGDDDDGAGCCDGAALFNAIHRCKASKAYTRQHH